jgi:5-methylcytosine-specific restriction protein A
VLQVPYRSPTRCAEPGCGEIATHLGRCSEHQRKPWENRSSTSTRYGMSGSAWQALKLTILKRDEYTCYVCGLAGADEVDHIIPVGEGGAKRDPSNLGAIHAEPCHEEKSELEKQRGIERRRRARDAEYNPD